MKVLNGIKRNYRSNRLLTVLNIAGLTIGLVCCLLLVLYIQHEWSFDSFHKNNICRVIHTSARNNQDFSTTPYVLGPVFKNSIPEIEDYVRIEFHGGNTTFIEYDKNEFNEPNMIATDPSFFEVFSFEFIAGERPEDVLSSKDKLLISENIATKYFGQESPLNKVVNIKNPWFGNHNFTVGGIYKEFPGNSHIQANIILPINWNKKESDSWLLNWASNSVHTYFKLSSSANTEFISAKIPPVLETYATSIDEHKSGLHQTLKYYFQPLEKIHLYSTGIKGASAIKNGSYSRLILFSTIAILILVIAIINFIQLSLSKIDIRLKNITLRKLAGASNFNIIKQVNAEFLGLFIISLFISIVLTKFALPYFGKFVGENISVSALSNQTVLIGFLFLSFILGILASGYVAISLLNSNNLKSINERLTPGSSSYFFRKALVVFQISTFIVLLTSSLYINKQLKFINQKDLGFEKECLLNINHFVEPGKFQTFRNELMKTGSIKNVSGATTSPISGGEWRGTLSIKEKELSENMEVILTDEYFLDTYKMELQRGRYFSDKYPLDKKGAIVVNETAAKLLGLGDETIGQQVNWSGFVSGNREIIGIVKDFHMRDLREKIKPMALLINTNQYISDINIKILADGIPSTLRNIESVWDQFFPGEQLNISFASQELEKAYQADIKVKAIIDIFTVLAIFVACLGFFGMAILLAQSRIKEIGIRKVNGAKVTEILTMLNRDFIKWVVIAFVIACPIAWFAMNKWLENFAYKTTLSWWIFALAGVLAIGIALFTVSFQSYKAATRNPIESLRYE